MSANLPPSELLHQAFQDFPRLSFPLVDPTNGLVSPGWYRFFLTLWKKTGASVSTLPGTLFVTINNAGEVIVSSAASGLPVATVPVGPPVVPPAPQVLATGASPFTYTALVPGTLLVFGGQLDFSRAASPFYPVGLTGGQLPLLPGDHARVTWFSTTPPPVTWVPSA